MEQNKNKKIVIMITSFILVAILGVAYALYERYEETESRQLIAGNVYLKLIDGTSNINLTLIEPISHEEAIAADDNWFTFSVEGSNNTSKDIYYEIMLTHGDDVENYVRLNDYDLKFDLVELDQNNSDAEITPYLVEDKSYSTIDHQIMYTFKINAGVTNYSKKFKLRTWISDDILVSDTDPNRSYCAQDGCVEGEVAFGKHFASIKIAVSGDSKVRGTEKLYDLVKADAVIDNVNNVEKFINNATPGINFGAISSDTNGKGVYLRAGTQNDDYPIYYYRGAVTNNNVYFAGFCWKIVRTTDTGGIKLIYAGENKGTESAPVCNNTGVDAQLAGTSKFNERNQSPAYVGYMYGDVYEGTNEKEAEGAYFGTGFNYENGVYSLKGAKVGIDTTHHYTCNLTTPEGTCESIRYYHHYSGSNYLYVTLTGGDDILTAIDKMQKNINSSAAKARVDEWYSTNMRSYTNKLEDTILCNDRGIYQLGGWNASGGGFANYTNFNYMKRRDSTKVPSLECSNQNDAFTVNNKKGNKMLTYPVALITADEIMLAGGQSVANNSYYLYTGQSYWSLSPAYFNVGSASEFSVDSTGRLSGDSVHYSFGLRPSVSLRSGAVIDKGTGVGNDPYIVS